MKLEEIIESKDWGVKHTGEWEGMSVSEIEKVASILRAKKERTAEESRRLKAADMAIRAKKAHGGKWKGVKAEGYEYEYDYLDEAKPSAGMSTKEKSAVATKARHGGDIGKKGKNFEKVAAKAANRYGSKEAGERVAAASMWKQQAKKH